MDKLAKLQALATQIKKDNVCPQLAKTAEHLVFGEGNPNAKMVFVGEAPGQKEDETGRPFVGPAGKLLDELLAGIGFKREDVYITSVLKYRPPHNRDPKSQEKADFWPYLQAQLEVIQPKLVATLGRHSLNCFLPDLQISKVHGKAQKAGQWKILPLYHPAAALYAAPLRKVLAQDFVQIPKLIN